MDTYSQWAGIANAAPYSSDGTNGGSVNAIRKYVFGSEGQNLTGWAQDVRDAQRAAFITSRNSGFTELTPGTRQTINPQFSSYLGNVKDLSILNPALNASQAANMVGTLTSTRGLYAAQMYGYRPLLSPGGKVNRNALGGFADSVMKRTFKGQGAIRPEELKASLGQNGSLHANIQAYVQSAGGDATMVQALEDYISGRNTAQQKGLSGGEFDKLLADYQKGGDAGKRAEKKLQKFGVSNTILQSQKDLSAAKTGNVSDLMDSLGPAVKKANEALEEFYNYLNDIVNLPGLKSIIGGVAGWGSVFGPAIGSAFGSMAGMRLGAGALGVAGSLMGMRAIAGAAGAGAAGGGLIGAAGGTTAIARAGAFGLGAYGVNAAGNAIADHIDNPKGKKFAKFATTTGTFALGGAAIGSVVPVVGTGLGAAIGGVAGAGKGLWDIFHEDSSTGNDGVGGGDANKSSKSSSAKSGSVITGKSAGGAINAALAQVGKPYQWGGTGPNAFDCSGLMQYAYKKVGVRLPRVSQAQMKVGKGVKRKDVRPGDLMFPHSGHVVMYIGDGKIVEAPRTGLDIRVAPVSTYGKYAAIRRVVGSVGSYSSGEDQDANPQKEQSGQAGGDSGSMILSSETGSTEEVEAITAAIAGVKHTLLNSPMNDSSSSEDESDVGAASVGDYDFGAIKGRFTKVPKPPSWVKSAVLRGMSAAHVEGAKWARGLVTIAYRESGFRKNAQNNWDSNAKRGTPSQGIMQVIAPTFKAYRAKTLPNDPFNPAASVAAAANYIESRYNDISRVQQANPDKPPKGYAVGAWDIPEDHIAQVHKGEMIIEKPKADTIRQALMRDVVNIRDAAGGRGGGSGNRVVLNFHDGAVRFSVSGAMTPSAAQAAANNFAQALAENNRLSDLGKGM
ncbi:NlpC/P60 family protein [Streptomyces sp. NPDC005551]|uniref:NlpC/P60 family protein n=1 Tax=Streptomyces sp. NPDC005551 TaxID=3364725 RepID=UPI0036A56745